MLGLVSRSFPSGDAMKTVGLVVLVLVLSGLAFAAAIFGVPTVYHLWKQFECWFRGQDSQACWELDLLKHPKTSVRGSHK